MPIPDRNENRGRFTPAGAKSEGYFWSKIQALGVRPEIDTFAKYKAIIEVSLAETRRAFAERRLLTELTTDKILAVHGMIFGAIHPWAGTFRGREKQVLVGGRAGADPDRIVPELELAIRQVNWMLGRFVTDPSSGEDLTPHAAIAFFHARYERIHPFRDGNGRSGRVILTSQVKEWNSRDVVLEDRDSYLTAMKASDRGFLTPLVNLIRRCSGEGAVSVTIESPFRISPAFFDSSDEIPKLEDFFYQSFL